MIEKLMKAFQDLGYEVERSGESFVVSCNDCVKYTCNEGDDGYLCISICRDSFGYETGYNMMQLHDAMERLNSTLPCIKAFFKGFDLYIQYERRMMPHEDPQTLVSNAISRLDEADDLAEDLEPDSFLGKPIEDKRPLTPGTMHNGHEWVDMGLAAKWATCNIGTDSPEEYGDCYSWGETEKIDCGKYDVYRSWGDISGSKTRDVARVKWGGDWRMPTEREMQELNEKCIWSWVQRKGVAGYRIVSKINGNSIFLPAACGCETGWYWSSTPGPSRHEDCACTPFCLFFHELVHHVDCGETIFASDEHAIRPVI